MKVGDSPVTVKLTAAPATRYVPRPQRRSPTARTLPTGYKNDIPY